MDDVAGRTDPGKRRPRSIGELRRRLDELGNPWTVPDELADDDPIPLAPHTEPLGPGHVPGLRAIDPEADLEMVIRELAPPNALLAHRRREAGGSPWGVG